MKERIAGIIADYSEQGVHRTGTPTDRQSAVWLADRIAKLGLEPDLDAFEFRRLDVREATLAFDDVAVDGVPLYDCTYTGPDGVRGRLGEIGSDADIGVVMALPFAGTPEGRAIERARREGTHKAIVIVTDERLPEDGIAILNAESFNNPYGPPVLQIASRRRADVFAAAKAGKVATVVARAGYVDATAANVGTRIAGRVPDLAPLVIMTPRSGWWRCASERGGGVACFLEMMRAIDKAGARRDVIFTANTGHELGHTGLDHWLATRADLIEGASMWIHLGANFAARYNPQVRLQYSDEQARSLAGRFVSAHDLAPAVETPIDQRPLGEARNIHDGGGRYISILGGNGLFHHPDDVWPDAVNLDTTTRWVNAFTELAVHLATTGNG